MGEQMRKIAILTLNGYFNYGNRLQNFALQEVLKSMEFEVETIIISNKPQNKSYSLKKRISDTFKKSPMEIYNRIKYKIKRQKKQFLSRYRTRTFKEFTLDYIKETDYSISDKELPDNLSARYDYFVAGSDQVWNPSYNYGSSIYFLTFTEKHKRITYAPSFGVSEIKPEFIERYREWISDIDRISVREDVGAKIIKDLTGKEVPVLVDPTLLLSREKWLTIAKEASNKPKEKYLLTYFLGGLPAQYKEQLKNIAKENKLEVINMGDIKEKDTYRTGPREFIDYINSCSLMCTDSYHGLVFSILFEKPFIVFERANSMNMYSRINTLLDKFDFNSRKVENVLSEENVFTIDFKYVAPILEAERKKSIDYLKEALNVKAV